MCEMKNSGKSEFLGSTQKGGERRVGGPILNMVHWTTGAAEIWEEDGSPKRRRTMGKPASGVSFRKKSDLLDRLELLEQEG